MTTTIDTIEVGEAVVQQLPAGMQDALPVVRIVCGYGMALHPLPPDMTAERMFRDAGWHAAEPTEPFVMRHTKGCGRRGWLVLGHNLVFTAFDRGGLTKDEALVTMCQLNAAWLEYVTRPETAALAA